MTSSRYFMYATFKVQSGTRIKEKQVSWIAELPDNYTLENMIEFTKEMIMVKDKILYESIENLVIENVSKL